MHFGCFLCFLCARGALGALGAMDAFGVSDIAGVFEFFSGTVAALYDDLVLMSSAGALGVVGALA